MNPEGERPQGTPQEPTPKGCPSCGARYRADSLFCSIDGAPLTTLPRMAFVPASVDPYLGCEILGHIAIHQLVGIGAMGRVYRAFQRGIDRDVAVKILHRELSSNQAIVARFHREAKVASRLSHPHVVHVLLVGQLPDGAMYIVMEYLDGMSLQSGLSAAGGALPLPRALHIALQLCEAAGEGHAQGIIHRDLKPENVMLVHRADDPDFVKVLDFGIARLNWDDSAMTTAAGLIFGTARYISPEGAQGEPVGAAGDVYSIATIIYQMLSGRTPFDAEQAVAVLAAQSRDEPPPLTSIPRAAYLPFPVAAVVMKNLAKSPRDRAPDARALGRALLGAAIESGLRAQDILARPALLDRGRGEHASVVQMPSLLRTKQHTLEKDVLARMTAPPSAAMDAVTVRPAKTAYETPGDDAGRPPLRTEIAPPGASTGAPSSGAPSSGAPFDAKPIAATLGPETTLDDQHGLLTPEPPAGPPSSATRTLPTPAQSVSTVAMPPFPEKRERGPGARFWAIAIALSVGVAAVAAVSSRTRGTALSSVDADRKALENRAGAARLQKRWDSPPGDNVREITEDGLAKWPKDAVLLAIRAGTAGDIVVAARASYAHGDPREAMNLARLASSLDASNGEAESLIAMWSREPEPRVAPAASSEVPPLATAHPASLAPAPAAAPIRVAIDVSSAHPGIGQPVDLAARVSGGSQTKLDTPRFRIAGPGILSGTEVPASDDGSSVLRATFTFLQAGRFDVTFSARTGGGAVRGARSVLVGDSPPASDAPQPAPNAKWL